MSNRASQFDPEEPQVLAQRRLTRLERPIPPTRPWCDPLTTVGVTGTNGKTSTTHMLHHIVRCSGRSAALLGTLGYRIDEQEVRLPGSWLNFQKVFWQLKERGGSVGIVELTSRALAQGYAAAWRFDVGVFTNLSPDHYSTHGSWEHYLASKAQLFVHLGPGRCAVLNASDPCTEILDQAIPQDVRRRFFGARWRGPAAKPCELFAETCAVSPRGSQAQLAPSEWAEALGGTLSCALVGDVFLENAMAAALAALELGIEIERSAEALATCPPVPGRFEVVATEPTQPTVVIDYAHSPDALARTLGTAKAVAGDGRVLLVVGAGGSSSPEKRPELGRIAGGSDLVFLTSDNPRFEDPAEIIAQLRGGVEVSALGKVRSIVDRAEAVEAALNEASPGDLVLIAGKGHERGQEVAGQMIEYSDHDTVAWLLGGP